MFDPESKQLVSRNVPSEQIAFSECPYCHRPLREHDDTSTRRRNNSMPVTATANFASPEYFRMLQSSQSASNESSRPASPHKRIQDGFFTNNQTSLNAEFVSSSSAPGARHGISTRAFSPNYFSNFFVEERELGRGNKGVVLLVKHVLDDVSLGHFALKRIPVGDDHQWLEKVLVEVQLLQHLSHQNLVSYRHVWLEELQITNFGPPVPCAFILQQYCNAGDLQHYLLGDTQGGTSKEQLKQQMRRRSKGTPEPISGTFGPRKLQFEEIYAFFKDIASGLNHLHTHNYIHRDLKPNNCLLHQNGKELRVLVSDFGEVQSKDQVRQSTGATGTISYCSPEVLRQDPLTGRLGNFSAKSDIFSLGMILYFLCFARLPYRNADTINEEKEDVDLLREEIISWIGLGDLRSARSDLPEKLYHFLRRLLSLDPDHRPTAEEILQSIKQGTSLHEREEYRISRIDTPEPDITTSSTTTSASSANPTSTAVSRLIRHKTIPSPLHFPQPHNSNNNNNSTQINEANEANLSKSLILRPSNHLSHPQVQQPPHPIPNRNNINLIQPLKLTLLLAKITSLYLICLPAAARPNIALGLLILAITDVIFPARIGWVGSIAIAGIHILILITTTRRGDMCIVTPINE